MKLIVTLAVVLTTTVLPSSPGIAVADDGTQNDLSVAALPGYRLSIFARGTSAFFNPDAIVVAGRHVFVAFQNNAAKDGTSGPSTLVDFSRDGKVVHTVSVPGHVDGLRLNPRTHQLWVTANEDANPTGDIVDLSLDKVEPFSFPTPPHGGGYDDLAFHAGQAFIAASNPNLNGAGVNTFPAVDSIVVNNGKASLTPVLIGNGTALDIPAKQPVTLNVIDPDSMTVDPAGDVVLVDQAGTELVFLHQAATPQQTVTRVPTGTQLDDTVWATSSEGTLFVVDGKANTIYTMTTQFKPGTVYTEAPSDSGVAGFVGTLDLQTGTVRPVAVGFNSPTGLLFVPSIEDRNSN